MSPRPAPQQAADDPVARVIVDIPQPHLDREFDYLVPAQLSESAVPGVRIRVRFAGRLVDGFLIDRVDKSDHARRLAFIERVVSAEPQLDQRSLALFRAIADRWVGTVSDVIRLAIPPRHAAAERAPRATQDADAPDRHLPVLEELIGQWAAYPRGHGFIDALATGRSPRAVWAAAPGDGWPAEIAAAVAASRRSQRGAVVVLPDLRHVPMLDRELTDLLGPGQHVVLHADLTPQERYRRWLGVRRGEWSVAIGTRSAAYAPVQRCGLYVCWDEGNDLHDEPRAPYPNARDVLLLRAHLDQAGALIGGYAPSVEAVSLLASGWAKLLQLPRDALRRQAPRVRAVGEDRDLANDPAARAARIPTVAWRAAQDALRRDLPVLVQVSRSGYHPGLCCASCRRPARCSACAGPLRRPSKDASAQCSWCGALATAFACPECRGSVIRAVTAGSLRTAEELGRAFPQVPVRVSGGNAVLDALPAKAMLVVSTPGAEPTVEGGYGAALLLDTSVSLGRADLRAAEETLRRWLGACALVRPASDGGEVVVVADGELTVVQALLRWDGVGFAEREAAERTQLRFPPAVRMAALDGDAVAIHDAIAALVVPPGVDVLGPVQVVGARGEESERVVLRIDRAQSAELTTSLHALAAARSARKSPGRLRIKLDPREVL